ncbi:hypothetical protein [Nocardioides sp. Soil805]|uniref:hypothetical protein n=1 Tax=Nocardioides sp. Soil805 TaxID=1736416 RepID=UPI000703626D|nr:hypothetical protein [Nocardioides sp. Soil805]KRF36579.1 hypothetical protein ASG94_03835 [Nocardioides sp. Soil805]
MSTRRGESLAARVAATQERRQSPVSAEDRPPPTRHCWYDGPHGRQAALLLEWRRVGGAWNGRIAVAAPDTAGWVLVEMWVDGGMLAPGPQ